MQYRYYKIECITHVEVEAADEHEARLIASDLAWSRCEDRHSRDYRTSDKQRYGQMNGDIVAVDIGEPTIMDRLPPWKENE